MLKKETDLAIEKISALMPAFSKGLGEFGHSCISKGILTMPQLTVFKCIKNTADCKMTDLSRFFNIKLSSVTGMVDRLVKDGYVVRIKDPTDKRVVRVKPTKNGDIAFKKTLQVKRKMFVYILERLSKQERHYLVKIMTKISKAVDQKKRRVK